MTEPLRNDWHERAELEREAQEGLELCGSASLAEAFYLARREEGMGDMEARLATMTRDGWPSRASASRFRPQLTAAEILGLMGWGCESFARRATREALSRTPRLRSRACIPSR